MKQYKKDKVTLIQADCMDIMKTYEDNYFDLAVVDPPYGIGDKFKGGKTGKMNFNKIVKKRWDKPPPPEYWEELFRVSKNQIVWGGNYFPLPPSRCFLVWDKLISKDFSLAMAELAWTSFDKLAKIYRLPTPKNGKIHDTQKPVKLYDWIFHNYAKPDFKILDTHGGSFSSAIAAYYFGCEFVGIEKDPDYFNDAVKRFKHSTMQTKLFK